MGRWSISMFCLWCVASGHDSGQWFLSQSEIDASRDGHSRSATGILDISRGNEVAPLVNGRQVMKSLLADINAATKGDSIHMTTFAVNGDMMLDPEAKDPEATKLTTVLIAAMKRSVHVRILVNDNLHLHTALAFCHSLNRHYQGPGDACVPESRHHSVSGSIHAKLWTFVYANDVVSYLGSMDIQGDRWDTTAHNDPPAREREPTDVNHFFGWHGEMFRLRGALALDVARHFYLQWNDPAPLPEPWRLIYSMKHFNWEVPTVRSPGNLTTQLLRTLSCAGAVDDGYYQTFAPRGEYTFTAAFKKMMAHAKSYVYLEDQFMFYDEALQAVADALPHLDHVIIVTDNATSFTSRVAGVDITVATTMRTFHQRRAFDLLTKNSSLAHKVQIFELAREGYELTGNFSESWLYTHAKVYMADDEFMLVGSHGIERTGFTNDIEVSLGVTDGTRGPDSYVGMHRRKIWAEFLRLGVGDSALRQVSSGVEEFKRQAGTGKNRVRHYYPPLVENTWAADQIYNVYEPEGRCQNHTDNTMYV